MGKITGFKEYSRSNYEKISPEVRIKNWGEMREETSEEKIRTQASRCMSCGIPFCSAGIMLPNGASGCPLHNLIPEWNDMVYRGQWQEAYERLSLTNPFPEFTGRVCPAPCEGSCTVGLIGEPVTISSIEYEIIEHAFQNGWVKPAKAPATGKRVAVVGSGPAGLATAHYLTSVGHAVTVFERSDRPGGLLMYGIPNMKLDKDIIQRRLDILEEAGVTFVCNTEIGKDIAAQELVDTYDAVVLCGGATRARGINVEGNDAKGVHMAMDFLTANTQNILAGDPQESKITAKDKHVIVIGGGDTGTDCVGTSIRHGAKSVHQFEIMPQAPDKRDANTNPWPEWPRVCKTDYGQEE
nr:glutamate synthase subunit beta [Trichococcus flocculiformis]